MKTKDLIRELQEADPSGEIECCVGNVDIWTITVEPAYYDGRLQVLKRDPERTGKCYDIIGGKYVTKGQKVVLGTLSITDILWEDPDAEIDYSECGDPERYKKLDDETRQAGRDVERKVEMDAFYRWVKSKAEEIRPGGEDCRHTSDYAYEKLGLSPKDPVKDLPPKKEKYGGILGIGAKEYEVWPSWNDRRNAMWDDTLEVYWRGGWGVRRKGTTDDESVDL
jgi:hypothetical protein